MATARPGGPHRGGVLKSGGQIGDILERKAGSQCRMTGAEAMPADFAGVLERAGDVIARWRCAAACPR